MDEHPPLTTESIDALLQFLPIFEADEFVFGDWPPFDGGFPAFDFSDDAGQFIDCLYHNNWVVPFDWPSWNEEAERLFNSPELLERADLETLRKLLTLHVRRDRFCEGHLSEMFDTGHLTMILERLRALRQDLP